MRILSIFGTRPEAIKMAPVIKALVGIEEIESRVCVTAQHREMLDQVLEFFQIRPDYDLDVMASNQGLDHVAATVLAKLTPVLAAFRPDRVLVQGDTTTTLAAALGCFYQGIRVGHVEAGLRSGDMRAPWPEEMNRTLTDKIADLYFAPTERAKRNLLDEGAPDCRVFVTGNTVVDALIATRDALERDNGLRARLAGRFPFLDPARRLIFVTGHRRESFGPGIAAIAEALKRLAGRGDVDIVYPVHPNPNVSGPIGRLLGDVNAIRLIDPLDYLATIFLMTRAHFIITDSGGIQEEAPSLAKPVLVTRTVTERPEAIEAGTARLVGTETAAIVGESERLLDDPVAYAAMARAHNPFGDGRASQRIVEEVRREARH